MALAWTALDRPVHAARLTALLVSLAIDPKIHFLHVVARRRFFGAQAVLAPAANRTPISFEGRRHRTTDGSATVD